MRTWETLKDYQEILFDFCSGIARITINRPRWRNAFTPLTVQEMIDALHICRENGRIRVIFITGAGDKAFCAGGDMHVKGRGGYVDENGVPRLNILDVQKMIRSLPKPVVALVNGYAIGGGQVLQVVGQKKAREIWFLCRRYSAQEALQMGLINTVVPSSERENEGVKWAEIMMQHSPLALRMIKAGLNAELDGQSGIQELAGDATMLYYMTDEAQEGGKAFLEKRRPQFNAAPRCP